MHRTYLRCLISLAVTFGALIVGNPATPCEDEHPPAIDEPVVEISLGTARGRDVLQLAFDPRGIREVTLTGDATRWTRPEDDSAWHYREWQWWKGHPWGDSCRPRYWTTADFQHEPGPSPRVLITYSIDGFENEQLFLMPAAVDPQAVRWDLVLTIRNASGRDVEEYGQFFACYTRLNRDRSFWYWGPGEQWELFSDHGVTHLDGYVVHPDAYFRKSGAIPHCPRGGGKIVGAWEKPVMISHASPSGWRSMIMLEAQHTASLAHGIGGEAMDYIVFPGPDQKNFRNGAQFSVHVRHLMLNSPELPTDQQLSDLWSDFETSHEPIKAQVKSE